MNKEAEAVSVCGKGSRSVKPTKTMTEKPGGDLVLQEIWRIKDELSARRGHDVHRLFAEARQRQKRFGHCVVDLPKRKNRDAKERTTKCILRSYETSHTVHPPQ